CHHLFIISDPTSEMGTTRKVFKFFKRFSLRSTKDHQLTKVANTLTKALVNDPSMPRVDEAGDIFFSAVCIYAQQRNPKLHRANLDLVFKLEDDMVALVKKTTAASQVAKAIDQARKQDNEDSWVSFKMEIHYHIEDKV